jgi:hypothetical protein
VKKILNHYHEALHEDGAVKVSLQAYVAAGGWVGIQYSYELAAAGGWVGIQYSYELDGFKVAGSQVPRRV